MYESQGRLEDALRIKRDVYSGHLRLDGEEHGSTIRAANNYAHCLLILKRFEEIKALLRKTVPMARRVLGESKDLTLKMRWIYARALYKDDSATLDDLREAVATLEETKRIARRVLGGAHPTTRGIELSLRESRAAFRTHEYWGPLFVCAFVSVVACVCQACSARDAVLLTFIFMVAWLAYPRVINE